MLAVTNILSRYYIPLKQLKSNIIPTPEIHMEEHDEDMMFALVTGKKTDSELSTGSKAILLKVRRFLWTWQREPCTLSSIQDQSF